MAEVSQVLADAIAKALSLLDEAEKAHGTDESFFLLWRAAAESEYFAFQISLANNLGDYDPEVRRDAVSSVDSLKEPRSLLEQARSSLTTDPKGAYRAARQAVWVMRTVLASTEKSRKRAVVPSPRNE